MQHDATEMFHLCFGSILVSCTIAHRPSCPVSRYAWLLHAVRQKLHSRLLYTPDRQSSDMRANLLPCKGGILDASGSVDNEGKPFTETNHVVAIVG